MPMDKKDAARKLLDMAKKLDAAASSADLQQWNDAYDALVGAWESVRDVMQKSTTTNIGDFFQTIGSGLIDAQKQLDAKSEDYVRSALTRREAAAAAGGATDASATPSLPSIFRIPRVSAELKCSLETNHQKSINLIFYSDRDDVREMHQQTVQLEVVSVPAPADYINYLRNTPPSSPSPAAQGSPRKDLPRAPVVVESSEVEEETLADENGEPIKVKPTKPHMFSFDEPADEEDADAAPPGWQGRFADDAARDEAKRLLAELDHQQNGLRRTLIKELLLPSWSQALVFTDGQNARFIALALQGKRPELLLWQLMLRPASVQLIYRLPAAAKSRRELGRISRFLFDIGQAQAKQRPDKPRSAT